MSERNIYITASKYNGRTQQTKIRKIFVYKTWIVPCADGLVDGTVNNQFSLDEYRGLLRIATTQNSGRTSSSNVFCLDYYLNIVGKIRKIAPGERIFSARYVDRRLYLVTFRQVDPFFVIDLSDHRNPEILGELKIAGFSKYLHPYDENTIIGFGRNADANGRQLGLKVSLFDVKDVSNPTELTSFILAEKYASSSAEWEHKAFLFSLSKNLMVVPGRLSDRKNPENSFNGAFVFKVKRTNNHGQIVLKGIINHVLDEEDNFWERTVERSLYI